ncbi:MAG: hypothetical protein AAF611_02425 [Bacteroidota bacterium]
MKKRSIKSLELNKKTISTLDSTNLKGGVLPTSVYIYSPIVADAAEDFIDGLIAGWNASND